MQRRLHPLMGKIFLMKIALLADVHANCPALEQVILHAQEQGVEAFWNLGDMVGYAPFPNETIRLLKKTCSRHVGGNYDLKALSDKRAGQMEAEGKDPAKIFSFAWTHEQLSEESVDLIGTMPLQLELVSSGKRFFLTHASPDGIEEGITPRTSCARLAAMARKAKADIVIGGHTHRFLKREEAGVLFVNPGSVGRPFDGDPRASYAVMEAVGGKVRVSPFRVPYCQEAMIGAMKEARFPDRLIRSLAEARSLDDLDAGSSVDGRPLEAVLVLARECRYEKEHAHQVAGLALRLFDELTPLHELGIAERALLQAAALLHDIGMVYGREAHHKSSRDIILKDERLPFSERERMIVALTARYHRKTLPESGHRYYADLSFYDREIVDVLSAILRVADGLDRSHAGRVKDVSVEILERRIILRPAVEGPADEELVSAKAKADLLERIFGRTVVL